MKCVVYLLTLARLFFLTAIVKYRRQSLKCTLSSSIYGEQEGKHPSCFKNPLWNSLNMTSA